MSLSREMFDEMLECKNELEMLKDIQGGSSRNPEWTEGSLQEWTLDYLKKVHVNDYARRTILVGKTGNGKSSTGNTLLGRTHFDGTLSSFEWTLDYLKKVHVNDYARRTILVGKTGNGKSSTGNTLLGRTHFDGTLSSFDRLRELCNDRQVRLHKETKKFKVDQDMKTKSQAREDGYETDRSSRLNFIRRYTSLVHRWIERGSEETLSTNDSYFQKYRVLKNSLIVLDTVLGTDSPADLFCKSEIVTYGEMYKKQGLRSNKLFKYAKDIDSGSYDTFISCLVQSDNEHLVLYLEEQEAQLEGLIMSETEKRQKSVKEKVSVSNPWQEVLTEVFRRTVDSESNLRARKQESEMNRSCLLKLLEYVCWNEDLNTSFLSDNNGKDLGEFTLQSDKEIGVSMHTANVPVKVGPIADGSYEMQADEAFRELEQMLMCKVCLDADLCILFLPCRHMATCESCASELQSCPVCRSTIQDSIKLNYE